MPRGHIRGWNRKRERRRIAADVHITVELIGQYFTDFLSQPPVDDAEAQKHDGGPYDRLGTSVSWFPS